MKDKIINLFIIIFTLFTSVVILEIYLKYNPSLFPTFGWQNNNILKEKIAGCPKKNSVGVFGDSFVEFYGSSNHNLVKKLSLKNKSKQFCNFGLSGTDIDEYINRFLSVSENINLNSAIFFIYEGNDLKDFFYKNNYIENNLLKLPSQKNYDRQLGFLRNFIKSTYTINIFYRYIIKSFSIYRIKIDEKLIKELFSEKNEKYLFINDLENINKKNNKFDLEKKALIESDIINREIYYTSLFFPKYYELFNNPSEENYKKQKKIISYYFDFINNKCEKMNIECNFIIIPEATFISKKFKLEFYDFFEFKGSNINKKSKIINFLQKKYVNVHYPEINLTYDDYLKLDGHLSNSGNEKLSDFVLKIIN